MSINQKLNNNSHINNELILFSNELADISQKILEQYFRKSNLQDFEKDDKSPITIADTEVESALRAEIEKKYPAHTIIGEEFSDLDGISNYKWYIDPIDGTSSFIMGKPIFTTLIALTYDSEPIFGLINQPITKERWQGGEVYQTNFNGINVSTKKTTKLEEAILATTSPYLFDEQQLHSFNKLRKQTKYQKYGGVFLGGDAYLYAMLASGHIDIILESNLKAHDFLALVPIIKSAGGTITDWQGKEITEKSSGNILACSTKELHHQVIEIINTQEE